MSAELWIFLCIMCLVSFYAGFHFCKYGVDKGWDREDQLKGGSE